MANVWTINGVAMPRNPSEFNLKMTKGNVSYQDMLDGTQRWQRTPRKNTAREVTLAWAAVSPMQRNLLLKTFITDTLSTIEIGGLQPRRQFNAYFDEFEDPMSKEIYDPTAGVGGIRYELTLTGRMNNPYLFSVNVVPSSLPSASNVNLWFGGPTLSPADGLPVWDGNAWQSAVPNASFVFSNLGSAGWLPVIKINGAFNTGLAIKYAGVDIDGTGQGVTWTWTGANVAGGSSVTFDTNTHIVKLNGTIVSTWSLNATSSVTPFPYWPEFLPGENTLVLTGSGGTVDLSNAGTERFRYS